MNKLETMLGFASKAGQLITGTAGVTAAIKKETGLSGNLRQ